MTNHYPSLEKQPLPLGYQPNKIQLFFDGVEVMRIENGQKIYEQLVPEKSLPALMQLFWDEEEVYTLKIQPEEEQSTSYTVAMNRLCYLV